MKTELLPIYDARRSFYHKAIVETDTPRFDDDINGASGAGVAALYSYGTLVAAIFPEVSLDEGAHTRDERAIVYGIYSATTLRHIKEFLRQNGFKAESKAQIVADYMMKD